MKIIVCVDQDNGMMFNNRRQSRDRFVIKDIIKYVGDKKIWMNSYSAELFNSISSKICVDEQFLDKAGDDDFCFVENCYTYGYDIKQVILYRWDKKYPADFKLDSRLNQYTLKNILEFEGYSHEKIIREIYVKE